VGYINSLTGLRGLAAFIVFISHCANQGMVPEVFGNGLGQIGVMLFFILSGFLMAHLYLDKDASVSNIKHYLVARVGRIFPLYYLLILFSVFISTCVYAEFHYHITELNIVARALLFIDAPFEFWTIPVEVQFYFVFVVFWLLYQRGAGPVVLTLFALLTIVPSIFLYPKLGYVPALFSSYSVPFFVGIITAMNYSRLTRSPLLNRLVRYLAIPAVIALFLNFPAIRAERGWVLDDHFFIRTWADPVNWIIVYGVFFCAMFNPGSLGFLNTRPIVFLGEISFGFYLIHYPILKIIKHMAVPVPLQFLVSLVVITAMAWLLYRFFEKPANTLVRAKLR
jgi:peptidoglycan/LPS O-acetylase OafA/YrhL